MEIIRKRVNMRGKVIVSIPVLFIVLVIIIVGYLLLQKIVNKKWGYTKEREKELEEFDENEYLNKKGSKWRKY